MPILIGLSLFFNFISAAFFIFLFSSFAKDVPWGMQCFVGTIGLCISILNIVVISRLMDSKDNSIKKPKVTHRSIIKISTGIFIAISLFPPWQFTGSHNQGSAGYSILMDPPSISSKIDFGRLLIEWAVLGAAAGMILFLKKENK